MLVLQQLWADSFSHVFFQLLPQLVLLLEHTAAPAISDAARTFACRRACVEGFVTHNGDLDYYTISGHEYSLSQLQGLLPHVRPSRR